MFTRTPAPKATLPLDASSPSIVESAVDRVVKHIFENGYFHTRVDPSRVDYIRVSSFPFCARAWFLGQTRTRSRGQSTTTIGAYFTSVGTTVHELVQKALSIVSAPFRGHDPEDAVLHHLPMGALVVQDWVCKSCRHRHEFTPYPGKCAHCGEEYFKNDEHTVRYSKHVLGHMDGTYAFAHKPGEPYSPQWVHIPIDYKTASSSAIGGGKLPYRGNADQLLSYGAIKSSEGYNVPGVALIYVCRDNPHKRKVCYLPLDTEKQEKRILRYERDFIQAREAKTMDDFMGLSVRTRTNFEEDCNFCPYRRACKADAEGDSSHIQVQAKTTLSWLGGSRSWEFPNF